MDTLQAGQELTRGQQLTSVNGYMLTLQSDGNLVLSENTGTVWASGTDGKGAVRAALQDDGNFVLYTSDDNAVWSTGTQGNEGARLVLQDDRNLVLFGGDGGAKWASNTNTDSPQPSPEAAAPAPAEEAPAAPAAPAVQTHTVAGGDTLWAIAERFYGDGNRYGEIASANGIANPDLIHPGQVLTIP
ncbi:LysM peptidoglycan-binding domain-containing protein [Lentzea sp. BCCO 10_0798]|uniref:LysM peptidoglycan-binding domain-containing protein n=1 Tax=Lentzea kristufekii TaxID=3095430 RepID=A0ABU4U038_9PSEU|nr:LysM peptidoglycan-binding domain-containing protein [Lentzea sp. BCCO 10_0798]MDX8053928.1 LysM peptidoglycan-binding domain-containing protein [Lentzea sp. BCCO 10_0798]